MFSSHSNHSTDVQYRTLMIQCILLTWKLPGYSNCSWCRTEHQFSLYRLILCTPWLDTLKKKSFKHYSRRTLPEDRRSCLHRQANTSGGKSSATKLSFGGDFLEFHPEPQAWCKLKENQTNKYFRHSNENLYKGNLHL